MAAAIFQNNTCKSSRARGISYGLGLGFVDQDNHTCPEDVVLSMQYLPTCNFNETLAYKYASFTIHSSSTAPTTASLTTSQSFTTSHVTRTTGSSPVFTTHSLQTTSSSSSSSLLSTTGTTVSSKTTQSLSPGTSTSSSGELHIHKIYFDSNIGSTSPISSSKIIGISVGVVLLLVGVFVGAVIVFFKFRPSPDTTTLPEDYVSSNDKESTTIHLESKYILYNDLSLKEIVGRGQFGVVYRWYSMLDELIIFTKYLIEHTIIVRRWL